MPVDRRHEARARAPRAAGVRRRDRPRHADLAVPQAAAGPDVLGAADVDGCVHGQRTGGDQSAPGADLVGGQQGSAAAVHGRPDLGRRRRLQPARRHVLRGATQGRQGRGGAGVGGRRARGRPRGLLRQRTDADVPRDRRRRTRSRSSRCPRPIGRRRSRARSEISSRSRSATSRSVVRSASRSISTSRSRATSRSTRSRSASWMARAGCPRTSSPCPADPPTGELSDDGKTKTFKVTAQVTGAGDRGPCARLLVLRPGEGHLPDDQVRADRAVGQGRQRRRCQRRRFAAHRQSAPARRRHRREPPMMPPSSTPTSRCRRRAPPRHAAARWRPVDPRRGCSTRSRSRCSPAAAGSSARAGSARRPPRSARSTPGRGAARQGRAGPRARDRRPARRRAARPRTGPGQEHGGLEPARQARDRELRAERRLGAAVERVCGPTPRA